jgi:predicted regulator of Ras-like GTPase activity (Roadblock/LC7/MglB family)
LTKSRNQLLVERLRELQASSPDIEASVIVRVDGLPIASALPRGVEEDLEMRRAAEDFRKLI